MAKVHYQSPSKLSFKSYVLKLKNVVTNVTYMKLTNKMFNGTRSLALQKYIVYIYKYWFTVYTSDKARPQIMCSNNLMPTLNRTRKSETCSELQIPQTRSSFVILPKHIVELTEQNQTFSYDRRSGTDIIGQLTLEAPVGVRYFLDISRLKPLLLNPPNKKNIAPSQNPFAWACHFLSV